MPSHNSELRKCVDLQWAPLKSVPLHLSPHSVSCAAATTQHCIQLLEACFLGINPGTGSFVNPHLNVSNLLRNEDQLEMHDRQHVSFVHKKPTPLDRRGDDASDDATEQSFHIIALRDGNYPSITLSQIQNVLLAPTAVLIGWNFDDTAEADDNNYYGVVFPTIRIEKCQRVFLLNLCVGERQLWDPHVMGRVGGKPVISARESPLCCFIHCVVADEDHSTDSIPLLIPTAVTMDFHQKVVNEPFAELSVMSSSPAKVSRWHTQTTRRAARASYLKGAEAPPPLAAPPNQPSRRPTAVFLFLLIVMYIGVSVATIALVPRVGAPDEAAFLPCANAICFRTLVDTGRWMVVFGGAALWQGIGFVVWSVVVSIAKPL